MAARDINRVGRFQIASLVSSHGNKASVKTTIDTTRRAQSLALLGGKLQRASNKSEK